MAPEMSLFADCEFWLVRHAETDWNQAGRWQGHADVPLSARGREQAEALAQQWADDSETRGLSPLFSSDLGRCVETAAALGRVLGLEPQVDSRLRELDVGDWSGRVRSEIEQSDPALLARFEAEDPAARPPGGETRSEIRERARQVIRDLAEGFPRSRIVVVTHRGLIRALLPDTDLGNAQCIRVSAIDALTRRSRSQSSNDGSADSNPL